MTCTLHLLANFAFLLSVSQNANEEELRDEDYEDKDDSHNDELDDGNDDDDDDDDGAGGARS